MKGLLAIITLSLLFWLVVLWAADDAVKNYQAYLNKQKTTIQAIYERGK